MPNFIQMLGSVVYISLQSQWLLAEDVIKTQPTPYSSKLQDVTFLRTNRIRLYREEVSWFSGAQSPNLPGSYTIVRFQHLNMLFPWILRYFILALRPYRDPGKRG